MRRTAIKAPPPVAISQGVSSLFLLNGLELDAMLGAGGEGPNSWFSDLLCGFFDWIIWTLLFGDGSLTAPHKTMA